MTAEMRAQGIAMSYRAEVAFVCVMGEHLMS